MVPYRGNKLQQGVICSQGALVSQVKAPQNTFLLLKCPFLGSWGDSASQIRADPCLHSSLGRFRVWLGARRSCTLVSFSFPHPSSGAAARRDPG